MPRVSNLLEAEEAWAEKMTADYILEKIKKRLSETSGVEEDDIEENVTSKIPDGVEFAARNHHWGIGFCKGIGRATKYTFDPDTGKCKKLR